MNRTIFTICAKNYLAQARVLMDSVRRHEPAARRVVVLSDRLDGSFDPATEAFEVLEIEALPIPDLRRMCFRYDILELATAVKPSVLRHLLRQPGCRDVVYLDPDIRLYGPLAALDQALAVGASGALSPHSLEPLPPGRQVGNATFQAAGAYNLGFLALAPAPEVLAALDWWEERLRRHCRRDRIGSGEFVDQKWMDYWPLRCPGTAILRDAGMNVAYWNLDQRPLRQVGDAWFAGAAPLVFLHFSGFRPGPPMIASTHRTELDESALGEGAALFHDYARRLRDAGLETARTWPYAFGQLDDGRPIPFVLRQFFREELEPCAEDPFAADWSRFTEAVVRQGSTDDPPLSRFMAFLAERNPDLGRHFRLDAASGRAAYRRWFAQQAASHFGLPPWLCDRGQGPSRQRQALAATP